MTDSKETTPTAAFEDALFRSVGDPHPDDLRPLLAKGADPNSRNHAGLTPLMCIDLIAADSVQVTIEVAKMLMEAKADPNAVDRQGDSVLKWHVNGQYESREQLEPFLKLLLEHKANPTQVDADNVTVIDFVKHRKQRKRAYIVDLFESSLVKPAPEAPPAPRVHTPALDSIGDAKSNDHLA